MSIIVWHPALGRSQISFVLYKPLIILCLPPQTQSTADEWLRRAELAVRKGQDELAREALQRRKSYETAAASLKTQLDAQRKVKI